jgi:predicted metal-dependent HD superfamily phosphohydrolase
VKAANRERWQALWTSAALSGDPCPWYERLVALYSEKHRHYHTLQHISECLGEFDAAISQAHDPVAVELAIWFHDAIYKPRAADNEERSAALAKECLTAAAAALALIAAVGGLVLDTKAHVTSGHPDSPLLIDIDLSILGQPEARFDEYERQVRAEYSWVPQIIFRPKRVAILRGFLDRPRIYATDLFFDKYEQAARANLERSLAKLNRR